MTPQQKVYLEFKMWRSLHRITDSEEFNKVYNEASEEDKLRVEEYINKKCKHSILSWMKEQSRKQDYSLCGIRELQYIGKQLGIRNYSRISKDELLYHIAQRKNRNETNKEVAHNA